MRLFRRGLQASGFLFKFHLNKPMRLNFCENKSVLEDLLKYDKMLEKSVFQCKGCGSLIHSKSEGEAGYIERCKLTESLKKWEYLQLRREVLQHPEGLN